jgi:hypothetical protein
MAENTKNIRNGNKVLFVGGPEAGNVRVVPESVGEYLQSENDFIYRIIKLEMPGHKGVMWLAGAADQHPMEYFLEMWREYSPAAQIQRQTNALTYNVAKKLGK